MHIYPERNACLTLMPFSQQNLNERDRCFVLPFCPVLSMRHREEERAVFPYFRARRVFVLGERT